LPAPPSSTLFPYTTLFRSDLLHDPGVARVEEDAGVEVAVAGVEHVGDRQLVALADLGHATEDLDQARPWHHPVMKVVVGADPSQDRKSTRLNSSHLVISYA